MKTPKGPRGIYIEDCVNVVASDNTFIGYETAIEAVSSKNITATNNRIISSDALKIFQELEVAIKGLEIDENRRAIYLEGLADLKSAAGAPSFSQKYQNFIAIAANHIGILGPLIAALAG